MFKKQVSLLREAHLPEDALYPATWTLCKHVCILAGIHDGAWYHCKMIWQCWSWFDKRCESISQLNVFYKTVWRLRVHHADSISILKSLSHDLFVRFASSLCMHQTHSIFSWIGPSTDECRHLDCGIPSGSSHLCEHDVRLTVEQRDYFRLHCWTFSRWVEDDTVCMW